MTRPDTTIEYAILTGAGGTTTDAASNLQRAVNGNIAEGWRPQGGVAIVASGDTVGYSQAVIRVIPDG